MDWLVVLKESGFPVTVCACLSFAAWKGLSWLGVDIIKPLATAHIGYLQEASKVQQESCMALQSIRKDVDDLNDRTSRILSHTDHLVSLAGKERT